MVAFRAPGPFGSDRNVVAPEPGGAPRWAQRQPRRNVGGFLEGPLGKRDHLTRLQVDPGAPGRADPSDGRPVPPPELTFEQFRQAVLDQQIANAQAQGRHYYPPVPANELAVVEGGQQLRTQAAQACRSLLAAARAALATAQAANDAVARTVTSIGAGSCYRPYERDRARWYELFPQYYDATRTDREHAIGGRHGRAAVQLLARYISPRKAAPGFSNHSNGTAVDFVTTQNGRLYTDETSRELWRQSWLHPWLVANAGIYHFNALASEEWHWDYR